MPPWGLGLPGRQTRAGTPQSPLKVLARSRVRARARPLLGAAVPSEPREPTEVASLTLLVVGASAARHLELTAHLCVA